MFVYFSGVVKVDNIDYPITATSDDDVRTIMQKALDLEFWGEINAYDEVVTDEELPESYIVFEVAYSRYNVYADNGPKIKKTNFDVTFVSKDLGLKRSIPQRIAKSLINKGFKCVNEGMDLEPDEKNEYFALQQEFVWYGVA